MTAFFSLFQPCMFLAGFVLGFLIFYVFSPLIFKTQLCCGPNGKEIGQWVLCKVLQIKCVSLYYKKPPFQTFCIVRVHVHTDQASVDVTDLFYTPFY